MAGVFITLEGGEGSGKSCLIEALSSWMASSTLPHIVTREPGGTPVGEKIRELFLGANTMGPLTETLLLLAARVEHVSAIVEPALKRGQIVLCDRYVDSTMAYQGFGRGMDIEPLWKLATDVVPLLPDLTLYLDVPCDVGFKRVHKRQQERRDRLEAEELSFHERVRSGFLAMAAKSPSRIVVLDALQDKETLFLQAQEHISRVLYAS
ncbi:MAG: dTMP kinase [Candidatus Marsarchaeota archaeon]|nr:dTMP kinase [Candidatus Marsarchaeota archaeon]